MVIPTNRGRWAGLLVVGLALAFFFSGRGVQAPAPGATEPLRSSMPTPAGVASGAPQVTPEKLAEPISGTLDPDCQQARDLLRAGADSQG